ncbi:MAG: OmpA family protein, partial [Bacteroidota bacterium]
FTTKIFQEIETASDGSFQFYLPLNRQFSILARKENYSTQSQLIESVGDEKTIEFNLFSSVSLSYNVFDADFYFPLQASASLYDSAFVPIENLSSQSAESIQVPLGKELNVIISTENYFSDTINLPFDKQVIFDAFEFDVELTRIVKEVSLTFEDEDGNNLGLEITVFNVTRNEKTTRYVKDGKIDLELRDGEVYEISTSAKGYSYYNKEIDLSKDDETEVNVELKSIEDVSLVLNNIIFATNSYELNASSYIELDNLIAYLSANEQYNVEIAAFTDDLGPEDYNLKLSNLRAVSVLEYLQDNSVSKDRLFAEGFGEDNPIVPNDTEDNRALNRRVEFKIVDAE